MSKILITSALIIFAVSTPAYAYIGPGLGAGTVGVILGVLGSILLALFAIFWYPIKRLFKIGKKPGADGRDKVESDTSTDDASQAVQVDSENGKE
jgi:hypothetical protein